MCDHAREHFLALYLDSRHRPIAYQIVSIGKADPSLVYPRERFQPEPCERCLNQWPAPMPQAPLESVIGILPA